VGNDTDISEVHAAPVFRVDRAACTSGMLATFPTATRCNNPRTELTSVINHCESLKSVIDKWLLIM
jgi:hypothetical protein